MVQPLKLNLSGNYTNDLPTISHNNRKMIKYIIVALDENGNENKLDNETYIISQIINIPIFKIY